MLTLGGDDLKTKFNMSRLIYIFIVLSAFSYAFVVELTKDSQHFLGGREAALQLNTLRYILYALSFCMFFVIKYVRKALLSGTGKGRERLSDDRFKTMFIFDIVTAALCESVAIFGLVLFLVGKQANDYYTLMLVSLVYFAYYFPRLSQWEASGKVDPFIKEF